MFGRPVTPPILSKWSRTSEPAALASPYHGPVVRVAVPRVPHRVGDPRQREHDHGDAQPGHVARREGTESDEEREQRDEGEHEDPERLPQGPPHARPALPHVPIVSKPEGSG